MVNDIAAIARQRAKAAVGRVARPAAFGIVAGVFFLFAVAALFYALFFWLEPLYGPPVAALIVAAVALVLGLLATAPLIVGRRARACRPARLWRDAAAGRLAARAERILARTEAIRT